jgi:hypothetical protein
MSCSTAPTLLPWVAALVLVGGTSMATERPAFSVVKQYGSFEVREYAQLLVAEVTVEGTRDDASNAGFRALAAYIFGGNKGARSIAMTAPVTQTAGQKLEMTAPVTHQAGEGGRWVIQFTMPSSFTSLEQLPIPNSAAVTLRAIPKRTVAVVTYSGVWSEALYAKQLATLEEGVRAAGLKTRGPAMFARYDPPWKPWFLRTNEIQLEVDLPPPG